jgi:hypothetical protein
MVLVDERIDGVLPAPQTAPVTDERAARRTLRRQIASLERQFSDAFLTAFSMQEYDLHRPSTPAEPRLLDLGELERVRDELAERLRTARVQIAERADHHEAARLRLEQMLLDPGSHRFVRINRADLGEPGCGAWEVRPRLGLVGMFMGWWQVKLSSGCPLAWGRGPWTATRTET